MVNKLIPALVSLCLFVLISFSSSAQFGCLDFSWELNGNECGLTNFEVTGNLGSSQLSVLISGPNTTDVLDIGLERNFRILELLMEN